MSINFASPEYQPIAVTMRMKDCFVAAPSVQGSCLREKRALSHEGLLLELFWSDFGICIALWGEKDGLSAGQEEELEAGLASKSL